MARQKSIAVTVMCQPNDGLSSHDPRVNSAVSLKSYRSHVFGLYGSPMPHPLLKLTTSYSDYASGTLPSGAAQIESRGESHRNLWAIATL